VVAVLVVAGLGSGAAVAVTSGSGPKYRLAAASPGSVAQTLTEVGTISAVNQASVSFPISGTVATVPVSVGQKVSTGQTIASLATSALNQTVASATAAVASAQQALAADESSEDASTSDVSVTNSSSQSGSRIVLTAFTAKPAPTGPATTKTDSSSSSGALSAAVTRDQKALVAAQQQLDADLAAATAALHACSTDLAVAPNTTPLPAGGTPATTTGPAQCLTTITTAPSSTDAAADVAALQKTESQLGADVTALQKAAAASAAAAAKAAQSAKSGAASGKNSTGNAGKSSTSAASSNASSGQRSQASSNSTGASTSGGATSGGATSGGANGGTRVGQSAQPATPEQLAADQAQIDAAQAQLTLAQQSMRQATLVSPITGTVAAVGVTAGKAVSASSTSSVITVIGSGQEQVSTTIGLSDIDTVKVGQHVSVSVDGLSAPVTGRVASIGLLSSTSGSSATYPVTILLSPAPTTLFEGSGASVTIDVASVTGVLTVPSSAVRTLGATHTVTVLTKGKPVLTRVTVGAVGPDRTQIVSGLKAGQQVVLATLKTPIPSSNTTSNTTRRFGARAGG
jgi:multidrug efflux pump subunit AcrA (membrane-fusion protein)